MDNENTGLSGIERELVLQYLMDGNVPVTLTPINKTIEKNNSKNDSSEVQPLNAQVFPIALKPEHIKVQKNGKIHLENPSQSVMDFENKEVRVEFYFNRVGLYFTSNVNQDDEGLYISIPDVLNRIKDVEEKKDYDFSAVIYFECQNKKDINTLCVPWENEQLFSRPAWKSIPLENQKLAKSYLEKFVELAKLEKNAGNGIQLIPVCNYLTFSSQEKIQSIQNRKRPLNILYVDHERIVIGTDEEVVYTKGSEYGLKLTFSIKNSPILSRDIFVTCFVNNVYQNEDKNKTCVDFVYTTMQEEDMRYLYEKTTKSLFI